MISETSPDPMLVFSEDDDILKANHAAQEHLRLPLDELLSSNISQFFQEKKAKQFMDNLLTSIHLVHRLPGRETENELTITRQDGTAFYATVQIGIKLIHEHTMIACTIRDITERKKHESLIKHMAYHDYLTDLPNCRAFNEQLTQELKQGKENHHPVSILFLDIDHFKNINDSLGHSIGDQVLKKAGNVLRSIIPDTCFLARIGGDEFTMILPNTERERVLEIADHILEAFNKPLLINDYELFVTTSIGLSMFPYDGDFPEELVRHADIALNQAKEQGKNKYRIFHAGMNIQTYRSFALQNDLRKAIDQGELEIYYQPRVNIRTGKIASAEVLLRWNHPNWGRISPGEFIPLAEQTGQITAIGDWVVKTVVQHMQQWKEAGYEPIRIAVNFSASQFMQKDLLKQLKQLFSNTGLSPTRLEIEITESALIKNQEFINETLNKIRELGMLISIDDFGTGYASLNYLSRLPVDILKIDQSFTQGITKESHVDRQIMKMIINLMKALNLSVVAEGVETEEQYQFLAKENYDEMQGYLLSHPLPLDAFEKLLREDGVLHELVEEADQHIEEEKHNNMLLHTLTAIQQRYGLTNREKEVFELVITGLMNKEISEKLFISQHTVKNHISNIFQKLGVTDRAQAMA